MLRAHGLDDTCQTIYWALVAEPGAGAAHLAIRTAVPEAAISTALEALVNLNLVRSVPAPEPGCWEPCGPEQGPTALAGLQADELAHRQREIAAAAAANSKCSTTHPATPPIPSPPIPSPPGLDDLAVITRVAPREFSELTASEQALLRFLAAGLTDEAAARRLGVSLRTVRRQVAVLMQRLGASSRFQAGHKAAERGWL